MTRVHTMFNMGWNWKGYTISEPLHSINKSITIWQSPQVITSVSAVQSYTTENKGRGGGVTVLAKSTSPFKQSQDISTHGTMFAIVHYKKTHDIKHFRKIIVFSWEHIQIDHQVLNDMAWNKQTPKFLSTIFFPSFNCTPKNAASKLTKNFKRFMVTFPTLLFPCLFSSHTTWQKNILFKASATFTILIQWHHSSGKHNSLDAYILHFKPNSTHIISQTQAERRCGNSKFG